MSGNKMPSGLPVPPVSPVLPDLDDPAEASSGVLCARCHVPLYQLEGVVRRHGERTVLDVPRLDIAAGGITGVVGPNGGGKSTLLRLLALLDAPSQGVLRFAGEAVGPLSSARTAELRRSVTLLLQEPYLLRRSVYENVAFGLTVRSGRGVRHAQDAVREALELVALDPDVFLRRRWFELSGGEAQRVALAARLAFSPRVLLMDEPTASLDEDSAARIADAARAVAGRGTTVIVVSHDRDWLEPLAGRILKVRRGQVEG
ncbi:ATP-binding cassette domain-containing protein [Nitratidesulfovibrio sp. HK-II]|uniref:ABC transporter ATP-binding protein n=1 Tax=Nitratidesulfovibrio sp. HK-II TaxID=2009266 RepID=UPI001E40DAB4|nr:ATP-binding cassette domain-containing protein [Nitratidesulfovibrio sp. HK-II]